MSDKELLWEKYKHVVDIHRSYMDLAVKVNAFYYAITGAIISFYFLHYDNEHLVRYSLVFPFVMSVGLAIFFGKYAFSSRTSDKELRDLARKLEFETYSIIAKALEFMLWVFFILFIIVAIGLLILFFR